MEKVLVICGGEHQIKLIKKVRELGYVVCNTNLYENSPGFQYAHETGVIDVLDKETNLEFARNHGVDAVISDQSEISVKTVAYVSESLGLPSITPETAELFTNKYEMREFCKQYGFDYPKYKLCDCVEDAITFIKENNCKSIIKPISSFSSRGVFTVRNEEDIRTHYAESASFSKDGKVIIEEYIEGTEFTIDTVISNGKPYTLGVSEKSHYDYNENIANALLFSYHNDNYDYDQLRALNMDLLIKTGIPFGLTHSEYKYCNGKFYLIEMAARGGGVYIASIILPFLSGVDNYRIYIESALGHRPPLTDLDIRTLIDSNKHRVAKLGFFEFDIKGETVKSVNGLESLVQDGILAYNFPVKPGDVIKKADDDSTRIGFYIIGADDMLELNRIESDIKSSVIIEWEE